MDLLKLKAAIDQAVKEYPNLMVGVQDPNICLIVHKVVGVDVRPFVDSDGTQKLSFNLIPASAEKK